MTIADAAKRIRFHLPPDQATQLLARVQRRVRPQDTGEAFLRALRDEMIAAGIVRPDEWVLTDVR
jgi:hypothetical protein